MSDTTSNNAPSGGFFQRLSGKLLGLVAKPEVAEEQADSIKKALQNSPEQPQHLKIVCYVLQDHIRSNALLVDNETRRLNLPPLFAKLEHDSLLNEKTSVIYLKHGQSLFAQTPAYQQEHAKLLRLINLAINHPELNIQLVPVTVLWGRSPDKEDSFVKLFLTDAWETPNFFKQAYNISLLGRQSFVEFHQPVPLAQHIAELVDAEQLDLTNEAERIQLAQDLVDELSSTLDRQREVIIGPDLSDRRNVVQGLLESPSIQKAIEDEALRSGSSIAKVKATAHNYLNEIVSAYSHTTVRAFKRFLTWVWTQLYDGVEVHHFERVRALAEDYTLVYTPSHRSHIDYLLLSYVIYLRGLMTPYIAAGDNLNMPMVGSFLRGGGAFFIRRSFRGNALYTTVINEYIHNVLVRNTPMEYFIEGGRSRTGRLLPPKTGMIAMTMRSQMRRDGGKPIAFIPTYIGYERLFEGGTYVGEMLGKTKEKESIWGLVKTLRKLERIFGKVHLSFGEPIIMDQVLKAYNIDHIELSSADDPLPEGASQAVNEIAKLINQNINRTAVINPVSLLSLVLLSTPKHALDENICIKQLNTYRKLAQAESYDEGIEITPLSGADIIEYGLKLKLIKRVPHVLGNMIQIEQNQGVLLTYFRNNIIHVFIMSSLIASLVQHNGKIHRDEISSVVHTLYPFLKAELFLKWRREVLDDVINREIEALTNLDLVEEDGKGNLYCPAPSSDAYNQLVVMVAPVQQSLERYFITLTLISQQGSGKITAKQIEDLSHLLGQRLSVLYEFSSPEFFDRALFRSFIESLAKLNYLTIDADGLINFDHNLDVMAQDARLVLNTETLKTLEQMATLNDDEIKHAIAALAVKSKKQKASKK